MQLEKYKKRTENNVAQSTLSSRMSALKNLRDFAGGGEVTVEDVEDWVDHMIDKHNKEEIKASTIQQYVKCADYYFETVKGETNALEHVKQFIPDKDVDHGEYLDKDEWEQLLTETRGARDKAILKILYYYARRPSEVLLLNEDDIVFSDEEHDIDDFDEDKGKITFSILKKRKGDLDTIRVWRGRHCEREMEVLRASFEMIPEVEKSLRRYTRFSDDIEEEIMFNGEEKVVKPVFTGGSGRMTYTALEKMISRKVQDAGIDKNITPKSMRHSRATHLDWEGHEPEVIARQQLAHGPNSDQIGAYIHERDEEQVRGVMRTEDEG